jgi:hypothetical protein
MPGMSERQARFRRAAAAIFMFGVLGWYCADTGEPLWKVVVAASAGVIVGLMPQLTSLSQTFRRDQTVPLPEFFVRRVAGAQSAAHNEKRHLAVHRA